jgi:hypothetical protein
MRWWRYRHHSDTTATQYGATQAGQGTEEKVV